MHNRQPKRARYLVWNRALVAEVMADAVNNDYHGSLRAGVIATNRAVEKAGHRRGDGRVGRLLWLPVAAKVDYTTAWRARRGDSNRLTGSTFSWVILFVGQGRRERLEEAVVSPVAQWLMAQQGSWEQETFARLVQDRSGQGGPRRGRRTPSPNRDPARGDVEGEPGRLRRLPQEHQAPQ